MSRSHMCRKKRRRHSIVLHISNSCFLYVFGLISPLPPPNSYTYIWPLAAGWPNNSPLCGGAKVRPWVPLSILIIWPCCPQTSGTRRQIIHSLHYTLWAVPLCVSWLMEKQGKHTDCATAEAMIMINTTLLLSYSIALLLCSAKCL